MFGVVFSSREKKRRQLQATASRKKYILIYVDGCSIALFYSHSHIYSTIRDYFVDENFLIYLCCCFSLLFILCFFTLFIHHFAVINELHTHSHFTNHPTDLYVILCFILGNIHDVKNRCEYASFFFKLENWIYDKVSLRAMSSSHLLGLAHDGNDDDFALVLKCVVGKEIPWNSRSWLHYTLDIRRRSVNLTHCCCWW